MSEELTPEAIECERRLTLEQFGKRVLYELDAENDTSESRTRFVLTCIRPATTKQAVRLVFPIRNEQKAISTARATKCLSSGRGNNEVCSGRCPPNTLAYIVLPPVPYHNPESSGSNHAVRILVSVLTPSCQAFALGHYRLSARARIASIGVCGRIASANRTFAMA